MVENVVVFGNCQAETLATAFQSVPGLAGGNHTYVRSFKMSDDAIAGILTDEVRDGCTLLFEQAMTTVHISGKYDFPNARRITFPSMDFNLLWPFRTLDKRTRPEPDFPYGRYVYGDRIINEAVAKGLGGDDAWDYYRARSAERMPDMARLAEIEHQRWRAVEAGLDAKISDILFAGMTRTRMFWNYNHPTRETLCQLGGRILQAAGFAPEDDAEATALMACVLTWQFGANYQEPVHPLVAKRLALDWWSPDLLYRHYEEELAFETWIRRQIEWQ